MPKKQEDLPAMEGPGVAKLKIKALEVAADEYVEIRDKRMALTAKEVDARNKIVQQMKNHGIDSYTYGDHQIVVVHGEDKVKVKAIDATPDDDDDEK